jgi:hypothetical protein
VRINETSNKARSNLDRIPLRGIIKPSKYILVGEPGWFEVQCEVHQSVVEIMGTPSAQIQHEVGVTIGIVILVVDVIPMPE